MKRMAIRKYAAHEFRHDPEAELGKDDDESAFAAVVAVEVQEACDAGLEHVIA